MRIVGGRWAGVALTSPSGKVRPTAEALRDACLTSLEDALPGARVLDLFAGSGALGLEALSRGAASADFVENGRSALHALKANVAQVRAGRVTRIFVKNAFAFIDGLEADAYDVAFADPPYASALAARVVEHWLAKPFARTLCVEHAPGKSLPGRGKTRQVGDGTFSIYRMGSWPPA